MSRVAKDSEWLFDPTEVYVVAAIGPVGSGKSSLLNNFRRYYRKYEREGAEAVLCPDYEKKTRFETREDDIGRRTGKGKGMGYQETRSTYAASTMSKTKGIWVSLLRTKNSVRWLLDTEGLGSFEGGPRVSFYRDVSMLTILNALTHRMFYVTRGSIGRGDLEYFERVAKHASVFSKMLELSAETGRNCVGLRGVCYDKIGKKLTICSESADMSFLPRGSDVFAIPSDQFWRSRKKQLAFLI